MSTKAKLTTQDGRLAEALGKSLTLWTELVERIAARHGPVERVWKPTKLEFGAVCLLKRKERTIIYLIPAAGGFEVSIVLGNRAATLALESDLRSETKKLISAARVYVEGRGVRFNVRAADDIVAALKLVECKMAPA